MIWDGWGSEGPRGARVRKKERGIRKDIKEVKSYQVKYDYAAFKISHRKIEHVIEHVNSLDTRDFSGCARSKTYALELLMGQKKMREFIQLLPSCPLLSSG